MIEDAHPRETNAAAPAGSGASGGTPRWSDTRLTAGLRSALPPIWLGLIIGISLIEAPLKFQAPGITIPLGLGIGRLVFTAMNAAELVIAALLLIAVLRRGVPWFQRWIAVALTGVLLVKVALIRPPLNRRTDMVLAGIDGGGSSWHYLYIAADGLLIVGLVVLIVSVIRSSIRPFPGG